ncbi:unnamed protein product [Camellia sinensis]
MYKDRTINLTSHFPSFLSSNPSPSSLPSTKYTILREREREGGDDKRGDGGGAVGRVQGGNGKGEGAAFGPKAYENASAVSEEFPFCFHFSHYCSRRFSFFHGLLLKKLRIHISEISSRVHFIFLYFNLLIYLPSDHVVKMAWMVENSFIA